MIFNKIFKGLSSFIFLCLGVACLLLVACKESGNDINNNLKTPKLTSMMIKANKNPNQLINDVEGKIIGDSVVEAWIPNIVENKLLLANFEYIGDRIVVNNSPSEESKLIDFKEPVKIVIYSGVSHKEYTVYVHSFTGLPVMWIETEGRSEIVTKDNYIKASFKLVEDVVTRSPGGIIEDSVLIKGRGNSTWTSWQNLPKKPYRLKFGKKVSLLDMPSDKSWVLLANYTDKTSLRNMTAFYMSTISDLDYTPRSHFVELMLNGRYWGTYQLTEKLKISKNRVNVGDDGFLMEFDQRAPQEADSRCFNLNHLDQPINIKDPDVEIDDEDYNYIKNFVQTAESVLFSENFRDKEDGWQKYMDINSFVDWYIIEEITKCRDANLWSSCYMNLKRDEKLKLGPIWDFDVSMGNSNFTERGSIEGKYEDFYVKSATWFERLFEDSAYVQKVKERYDYFYSRKKDIMNAINENASYLQRSVVENDNKWHTLYLYAWPNYDVWGSYLNEVQSLKEWINNRMDWLKGEFDRM